MFHCGLFDMNLSWLSMFYRVNEGLFWSRWCWRSTATVANLQTGEAAKCCDQNSLTLFWSQLLIICHTDHISPTTLLMLWYSTYPHPTSLASQAKHNNKVLREPVFKAGQCKHMSHAGLLLAQTAIQCSSTSTRAACRAQTAVSCPRNVCNVYNSSSYPQQFVSMRLHSHTPSRAYSMDASTVTKPLVTPFWGLSVVQVINTDLHIVFLFVFICLLIL